LPQSRDFDTPALDQTELGHLYERALKRSAQLRARRARLRIAGGTAALACLLAAGLVTAALAGTTPGRRTVAGSSTRHTAWRLVSEVSAAASSWRALSPSGYQQAFALVCPSATTCYADSIGGQLEYTHDGGFAWQHATGTGIVGTATSLPQISCLNARDCDVQAEITGRRSTFLTTTDGGRTWTSEPGPAVPAPAQNSSAQDAMSCATISSCTVIAYYGDLSGSSSEVFTTSDGGASWSQSTFPSPASGDFMPSGVSCTGTTCVAVGLIVGPYHRFGSGSGGASGQGTGILAGAAYTSDDGGATWSASSAPPSAGYGLISSLTCPDATNCYAIATGAVFETRDGGQTWGRVRTSGLPAPSGPYHGWGFGSISCASSSSCWLTGAAMPKPGARDTGRQQQQYIGIGQAEGLLASTADGGSSWVLSTPPAGVGGVIDVTCPDTTACFALGVRQTGSAPSDSEVVLLTNAS
jgi:photosystem II stability/assembly factor-like uncharacterized protein